MSFNLPQITTEFYAATAPVLLLCLGCILAMLQAVSKRVGGSGAVFALLMVTLIAALVGVLAGSPAVETAYLGGGYIAGELTRFGQGLILIIALGVSLIYRDTFLKARFYRGEIASLFMMIVAGMLVMVASEDPGSASC